MTDNVLSQDKKEVIKNLYLSGIGEEFIAMQLDLEIPVVIQVLKELGEYNSHVCFIWLLKIGENKIFPKIRTKYGGYTV